MNRWNLSIAPDSNGQTILVASWNGQERYRASCDPRRVSDCGRFTRELAKRYPAMEDDPELMRGLESEYMRLAHELNGKTKPAQPVVGIAKYQAFPVEALPKPMRAFVGEVAKATGTDPGFAALAALVVVAGCLGNRVAALVKKGWIEPAVLWGAVVGGSGTTKSPVLKPMTRALVDLYKQGRAAFVEAHERYRREKEFHAVKMGVWKAEQKAGKVSDPPMEPDAPVEERVLVSDSTLEKLCSLLAQNPLGLLLVRDELAAWVGSFDRYAAGGKGSDAPAWLSMHDANAVLVDRKSEAGTIFVDHAAVSVLGGIQPGTLRRVFGTAERESGLLARLLLCAPPERPTVWTDDELSDEAAAHWRKLLEALLALKPGTDEQGNPRPKLIAMGDEAKALYVEWHDAHGRERVELGDDDLAAHYAKLKGACVRIALLFECVEVAAGNGGTGQIGGDAMRKAIAVTNWFKAEAGRVYTTLGETAGERASRRLVEMIEAKGGQITARELRQRNRRYRDHPEQAEADLQSLVEAKRGRWAHLTQGGRPSKRFILNDSESPDPAPVYAPTIHETPTGPGARPPFVGVDDVEGDAACR